MQALTEFTVSIQRFFAQTQVSNYALVVLGALIFTIFIYWYEIKRDGFDEERAFDILLLSLINGVLFSRFTYAVISGYPFLDVVMLTLRFWEPGFNVIGLVSGLFLPIFIFPRFWNWSIYRISDIFAISFSLGLSLSSLGWYFLSKNYIFLISFGVYLIIFVGLYSLRLLYRSGLAFSLFIIFSIIFSAFNFRASGYIVLYVLLGLISLFNLYMRETRNISKFPLKTRLLRIFSFLGGKKKKSSDKYKSPELL